MSQIDMEKLEQELHAGIQAILGENGLAVRDGAGEFIFNPQQFDYANRTASSFCRFDESTGKSSLLMLQAATGTGKTLGYLVPLMLFAAYTKKRVAVSTYTRHLQHQILNKDAVKAARWIQEYTGIELSVCRRIGKSNYVSPEGCARLIEALTKEDAKRFAEGIHFVEELLEWAEDAGGDEVTGENEDAGDDSDKTGILDDFMEDRRVEVLPDGVKRQDITFKNGEKGAVENLYQTDLERSKAADVLIVNHALMVVHAYRWSSKILDAEEGRPISVAVFDEADRLERTVESIIGADVSINHVMRVTEKVGNLLADKSLVTPIKVLHDHVMAQKIPSAGGRAIKASDSLYSLMDATLKVMQPAAKSWCENEGDLVTPKSEENAALMADFADITNDLLRIRNAVNEDGNVAIVSWSPIRAYPSLSVGRPNPGRLLSRMWSLPKENSNDPTAEILPLRGYLDAALFTSATLAVSGKSMPEAFDDFSGSVGIVRRPLKGSNTPIHNVQVDLMHSFQPGKFGEMSFVLADPNVNNPTVANNDADEVLRESDPKWLDYCAEMIRAAKQSGGRTMVLTHSWRDTIALEKRLENMPGLIVHKRGDPLRASLPRYKTEEGAVLISPSAWEGVDLPGMVNQLVITRIPFLPPDRAEQANLRIFLAAKGYSEDKISSILYARDAINTRRTLEQGFGRGLRAPSDKVTVWIADPRFPFPEVFYESLDPVLMNAPVRPVRAVLRSCIPRRFLETTYPHARIFLENGNLHEIA